MSLKEFSSRMHRFYEKIPISTIFFAKIFQYLYPIQKFFYWLNEKYANASNSLKTYFNTNYWVPDENENEKYFQSSLYEVFVPKDS